MNALILVAALGYFVDVYDLILFSIVRIHSLEEIGLSGSDLLDKGLLILNLQMIGMLLGGILWGILGDKKGRLSVLFGSILLYSLANIANGFVQSVEQYAVLRFIAGIGLAGELGAGITLVAEALPKNKRGMGTTIVAAVGVTGAIAAAIIGGIYHWRTCYFIGGALGLALLALRISVRESSMFQKTRKQSKLAHGNISMLFNNGPRFKRYIKCLMGGLPIWGVLGILVSFAPELAKYHNLQEPVLVSQTVLFAYIGLTIGDLGSGILSQILKSRKKVLLIFQVLTLITSALFLTYPVTSAKEIYMLCIPMGIAIGYWAVFVTSAAEQFGTNLRSTVTTTTPNFARGMVTPLTLLFTFFKGSLGLPVANAALFVMVIACLIAIYSTWHLKESFSADLDFVEM
ncbi:MAG: MFS transporter [Proteobacteria bacterium]|nr:MFS transporter [Pseudomonadota bacterium]